MDAVAREWPLLAGFLTLYGSSLFIIRGLYERIITDLKAALVEAHRDVKEERQISRDATAIVDKLSDRLDAVLRRHEQEGRRG